MSEQRMSEEEFERSARSGDPTQRSELVHEARRARAQEARLLEELREALNRLDAVRAENIKLWGWWQDAAQTAGRLEKEAPGLRVELAAAQADLAERLRLLETERARAEMAEQTRDGLLEENGRLKAEMRTMKPDLGYEDDQQ